MRVTVAAVGRMKAGAERDLCERYARQIKWKFAIREVEERSPLPPAQLKAREGEKLLACCPDGAVVVALDQRGEALSSEELAARLGEWWDSGVAEVVFAIGGAEGLDEAMRDRADLVMAFGTATWPHMLVRAMVVEQVYRAQQILAGHPYHRG